MKNTLWVMAFSTAMLLGCGIDSVAQERKISSSEYETSDKQLTEEINYEDLEVEVIDQAYYAFDREADKAAGMRQDSGGFNVSGFAAIKNISEVPIDLEANVSVDFYSKDGKVISKVGGHTANPLPKVLQPGEVGYIEASSSTGELAELKEMKINVSSIDASFTPIPLEAENIEIHLDTKKYISPAFKITGTVENETEQTAQGASIGAGLYDADGKFLATMQGAVEDVIKPGKSVAFELSNPEFPLDVMKQVKEVKITASYIEDF